MKACLQKLDTAAFFLLKQLPRCPLESLSGKRWKTEVALSGFPGVEKCKCEGGSWCKKKTNCSE